MIATHSNRIMGVSNPIKFDPGILAMRLSINGMPSKARFINKLSPAIANAKGLMSCCINIYHVGYLINLR